MKILIFQGGLDLDLELKGELKGELNLNLDLEFNERKLLINDSHFLLPSIIFFPL